MKLFDLRSGDIFQINNKKFKVVGWKRIKKAHKYAPGEVFEVIGLDSDKISWFTRDWDVEIVSTLKPKSE